MFTNTMQFPKGIVQRAAVEAAFALAERCEPKLRVGVHLGDVVVQPNGDLLGHGVNVAARLMAQSQPGSVPFAVHFQTTASVTIVITTTRLITVSWNIAYGKNGLPRSLTSCL